MKLETLPMNSQDRRIGVLVWALVLAAVALPATAETDLHVRDAGRVFDSAVSHYYFQKTEKHLKVESACYFDPQVETSMSCTWRTGQANPYDLRQKVKKNAEKWCKKNNGENCILFWRNGKLEFDTLSSEQSTRLESILQNIPSYDTEAKPLPEGIEIGSDFRDRFEKVRDYWDGVRSKNRGKNAHYALCASNGGHWGGSYQRGGRLASEGLRAVREMCVLKCKAIGEWLSEQGECYLVYEDGKFASAAARNALTQ